MKLMFFFAKSCLRRDGSTYGWTDIVSTQGVLSLLRK